MSLSIDGPHIDRVIGVSLSIDGPHIDGDIGASLSIEGPHIDSYWCESKYRRASH